MRTTTIKLPSLDGPAWATARDAVHAHARVVGALRGALTARQRHWSNVSLRTHARGLTTTSIHTAWGAVEIRLDLLDGHATLMSSDGRAKRILLTDLPASKLATYLIARLAGWGVRLDIDPDSFGQATLPEACLPQMRSMFNVLLWVDGLLTRFRAEQRNETSEVQLWPHHFDIAMLWFSGRKVPGEDPSDEAKADEQMNFGFAFGDAPHPDPYFYITAYPLPDGLEEINLPAFAGWQMSGWSGVFAGYDAVRGVNNPFAAVIDLMRSALATGESLMED
jgi:hypothetical protein